jgi:hypothetical protein
MFTSMIVNRQPSRWQTKWGIDWDEYWPSFFYEVEDFFVEESYERFSNHTAQHTKSSRSLW